MFDSLSWMGDESVPFQGEFWNPFEGDLFDQPDEVTRGISMTMDDFFDRRNHEAELYKLHQKMQVRAKEWWCETVKYMLLSSLRAEVPLHACSPRVREFLIPKLGALEQPMMSTNRCAYPFPSSDPLMEEWDRLHIQPFSWDNLEFNNWGSFFGPAFGRYIHGFQARFQTGDVPPEEPHTQTFSLASTTIHEASVQPHLAGNALLDFPWSETDATRQRHSERKHQRHQQYQRTMHHAMKQAERACAVVPKKRMSQTFRRTGSLRQPQAKGAAKDRTRQS